MVVFDTDVLSLLLHPEAYAPEDPDSGDIIEDAQERLEYLVQRLESSNEQVLLPTPVLSEFLVFAGSEGPEYLAVIDEHACFKVVPFDQRAAIELAATIREAIDSGDKKSGVPSDWAKVKFDRQIVSIAKAQGAHTIYSNDRDVAKFASLAKIQALSVFDLPPAPAKDQELPFPDEATEDTLADKRKDEDEQGKE